MNNLLKPPWVEKQIINIYFISNCYERFVILNDWKFDLFFPYIIWKILQYFIFHIEVYLEKNCSLFDEKSNINEDVSIVFEESNKKLFIL